MHSPSLDTSPGLCFMLSPSDKVTFSIVLRDCLPLLVRPLRHTVKPVCQAVSTIPAAYSLLANGLATTKVGVAFPILTCDRYADSLTSGSTSITAGFLDCVRRTLGERTAFFATKYWHVPQSGECSILLSPTPLRWPYGPGIRSEHKSVYFRPSSLDLAASGWMLREMLSHFGLSGGQAVSLRTVSRVELARSSPSCPRTANVSPANRRQKPDWLMLRSSRARFSGSAGFRWESSLSH
jgi:hypothetical protein